MNTEKMGVPREGHEQDLCGVHFFLHVETGKCVWISVHACMCVHTGA